MKQFLAMLLSISAVLSSFSYANSMMASAAETTTAIVEDETSTTTTTITADNGTTTEETTTTTAVESEDVETTTTTTVVDEEETETTTVTTVETEPVETTTTWDRVSNWPGEDGYLRFWMDDLEEGRMCSITLTYTAEDNNKPISGAKVTVYKIATLTVKYGDAKYTLIDELLEDYPELDFAGMSTDDLDALAAELATKGLAVAGEAETDANGKCTISDLEPGLYVVRQIASVGVAKDYEEFKPFILNAPFPITEDELYNGQWLYDVDAIPKTELKGKKKTLIIPPTGDDTNKALLNMACITLGVSVVEVLAVGYLILSLKKKSKEEENKE